MKETGVRLLERALAIIDVVAGSNTPMGVNHISEVTEIHPSTCFRILQTLVMNKWINQDINGKYTIGLKAYQIGNKFDIYNELKKSAYYIMQKLSEETNEAVNISVRDHDQCFILQQTRGNRLIYYVAPAGSMLPLHSTAATKVLLSELSEKELKKLLEKHEFENYTVYSIATKEQFFLELEKVRSKGYAEDRKETTLQGMCIAVPIRDDQGEIIAALSISGILTELQEDETLKISTTLKAASLGITQNLYN